MNLPSNDVVATTGIVLTAILASALSAAEPTADLATYQKHIKPLLARTCVECHGPDEQEGNFRLDQLDPDILRGKSLSAWQEVLAKTQVLEMPPPKHPRQPTGEERQKLLTWLRQELSLAAKVRSSTGGRGALRRLTRDEYVQTMQDLLGVRVVDFGRDFPTENRNRETGFANDSREAEFNHVHLGAFLRRARAGLDAALVLGKRPPSLTATLRAAPGTINNDGKLRGHRADNVALRVDFDPPLKDVPWHEETRVHDSQLTIQDGAIALPRTHRDMSGSKMPHGVLRWFLAPQKRIPRGGELRVVAKVSGRADGDQVPHLRIDIGKFENEDVSVLVGQSLVTSETPVEIEFRMPWSLMAREELGSHIFIRHTEPDLLMDAMANPEQEAIYKKTRDGKPLPARKSVLLLHELRVELPYFASWPPPSHAAIVGDDAPDEAAGLRRILARFMERVWRRPPTDGEVAAYTAHYTKLRPTMAGPIETLRETLANVLVAPQFIYLAEPVKDGGTRTPLDAWALASRLSYALTGTLPDETLRKSAAAGKLTGDADLRREAERLLADPRSERFLLGFADAYLGLHGLDAVNINPEFYGDVEPDPLRASMRGEARHFVAAVFRRNLPAKSLIEADFLTVDRRLARHYGIPLVPGNEFTAVPAKDSGRQGGILHLSAVHLMNSTGEHSHAIKRAVWLRRNLLDQPPGDPPPAVPSVPEDHEGLSLTKRIELHRNKVACRDCHASIDPYGLPFEGFDAVGRLRPAARGRYFVFDLAGGRHTVWTGQPVESKSTLPDGTEIAGLDELRGYLASQTYDRFEHALVHRLASYMLARSMEFGDQPLLDELRNRWRAAGGGTRDLVLEIVMSPLFRTR